MSARHAKSPTRRFSAKRMLAVGSAAALVVSIGVAAHAAISAKSPQSHAVKAVVGSGVMTNKHGGFHGKDPVTRAELALALQRSVPRLALSSASGSATAAGSTELGSVRLRVDGAKHKQQGVLLTFNGQLDHDSALTAGCFPSFTVTRDSDATVVGSRTQEEYGGGGGTGLELPVSMQFLALEKTGTSVTYNLTLTNPCNVTIFIDGGDFSAQNVTLAGNGQAIPKPARLAKQVQSVAPHDR